MVSMLECLLPQARVAAGADAFLVYTPPNSSLLVGSDFTSFFIAAHEDASVPGVRLAPGEYQVNPGSNPDSHVWLPCNPVTPRSAPFVVDISGSTFVLQVGARADFVAPTHTQHHMRFAVLYCAPAP